MGKYTRIQVVENQINTAIDLFFGDKDPVSLHTLTCASYEILEVLGKEKNVDSILIGGLKNLDPKKVKQVRDTLNAPYIFFKHSNKDIDKNIEFNEEVTTYYLYDCCRIYRELIGKYTFKMFIYVVWFALKHPDVFPKLIELIPRKVIDEVNVLLDDHPSFYKAAFVICKDFDMSKV